MKIGGKVCFVCYPNKISKLKKLINYLTKIKQRYIILGNGTNTIFDDGLFDIVVISTKKFNKIDFNAKNLNKDNKTIDICDVNAKNLNKNSKAIDICDFNAKNLYDENLEKYKNGYKLTVGCGVNLFYLCNFCMQNSLGGLDFAYGIPGSMGGAVVMNAGAHGGEIKNIVSKVWVLENGKVKVYKNKDCKFDYRTSLFKDSNLIVLKAELCLKHEEKSSIQEKYNKILKTRKDSQPYGTFNAGSIFKKIEQESAGKIIDKLCLKGVIIGDMQISPKHANFFVNLGNASFRDFESMLLFVKNKVKQKTGKTLQEEVVIVKK